MSANFTSGFFVREPAWHGMGIVLDDYPGSWEEARKIAGLEWEPVKAPMYGFVGKREDGTVTFDPADAVSGEYAADDSKRRIIRSDTYELLGAPTDTYEVISHAEMGSIIEAVAMQPGINYETTVCLEGGKSVAAVLFLDEPVRLPRDKSMTFPYMALTTRHDGTGSCRAQSTTVRIVCANTFAAAEAEADRNGTVFVFSHTKNWRDHIEEAQQAVRGLRGDFGEYVDFAKHLTRIKVDGEQTSTFLAEFIPAPLESVAVSKTVARHIEEARLTVKAILASPTCEGISGTAFGLVQAGGEYLDHYRGYQSRDTYCGRQLLKPEPRKRQLVQIVKDLVSA